VLAAVTNLFPVWVLLGGALALVHPPLFAWFRGPAIVWGLAVVMLGMGITMTIDDFRRVWHARRAVATGFAAQYTIMPLVGWLVALAFRLDPPFAVGVILVGCCPGGTASNVVTYLARADVALSVLMTTCSTIGAVVMTPMLTALYAGAWVSVDAVGLLVSTVQVVLLPVALGLALNQLLPGVVRVVLPAAPLVSVLAITLISSSIIAQSAEEIRIASVRLVSAVLTLHGAGYALGYLFSRAAGYGPVTNRTVSIEVGMQNSGLGVVLARQHFADPLTAVPCAMSAVVQAVTGSLLAAIWRQRPGAREAASLVVEERAAR
jgi:BASS family bile acid:Na+ symporter